MTVSPDFIKQIQGKMIGAIHLVLEQIERAQAGRGQRDTLRVFLMRRAANQAGLWDACAHRACKRARGCRRLHGQCLGRASEAARAEGRSLLARGKFDALLALLPPGRR
jgi:hypothetical protein